MMFPRILMAVPGLCLLLVLLDFITKALGMLSGLRFGH